MTALAVDFATSYRLAMLIGLFRGDEDSEGYPTTALALAICKVLEPKDLAALRDMIFDLPDVPEAEREEYAAEMISYRAEDAMTKGYNEFDAIRRLGRQREILAAGGFPQ